MADAAAAGQHFADLEAASLEPDDWLRPDGRREHGHVARYRWVRRPSRDPGGGQRGPVHIPPVLDQGRPWGKLRQQAGLRSAEHQPGLWLQGHHDGIARSGQELGR